MSTPCDLVEINCIDQYCMHRVVRQLGLNMKVPKNVCIVNSDSVVVTFKMEARGFTFIDAHRDAGVP